ncbi:hypothetical protein DL98DRAFT_661102 [Cadophora sp. DSE1049]|nr:hypothetical protein DL98DRAFT_661102 [Cadophora sp. DSE1049]
MDHVGTTQQGASAERGIVQMEDGTDDEYESGKESAAATDLLGPEAFLSRPHPSSGLVGSESKGTSGAIYRLVTGVPPEIRVVNESDDQITVTVSPKRPRRLLTSMGADGSASSGGINFDTTLYNLPAAKQTLAPKQMGHERSSATFPLFTRRSGCGVVSISIGDNHTAWIENSRVQAGTTVCFTADKVLKVVPPTKEKT